MMNSTSTVPDLVQERLRDAGFDVRFGLLHGLWHMVAELDDATFAVSGFNPASVANSLMEACAGEIELDAAESAMAACAV